MAPQRAAPAFDGHLGPGRWQGTEVTIPSSRDRGREPHGCCLWNLSAHDVARRDARDHGYPYENLSELLGTTCKGRGRLPNGAASLASLQSTASEPPRTITPDATGTEKRDG